MVIKKKPAKKAAKSAAKTASKTRSTETIDKAKVFFEIRVRNIPKEQQISIDEREAVYEITVMADFNEDLWEIRDIKLRLDPTELGKNIVLEAPDGNSYRSSDVPFLVDVQAKDVIAKKFSKPVTMILRTGYFAAAIQLQKVGDPLPAIDEKTTGSAVPKDYVVPMKVQYDISAKAVSQLNDQTALQVQVEGDMRFQFTVAQD